MKKIIEIKKKLANDWFKFLQEKIIDQFQSIENESSKKKECFDKMEEACFKMVNLCIFESLADV